MTDQSFFKILVRIFFLSCHRFFHSSSGLNYKATSCVLELTILTLLIHCLCLLTMSSLDSMEALVGTTMAKTAFKKLAGEDSMVGLEDLKELLIANCIDLEAPFTSN